MMLFSSHHLVSHVVTKSDLQNHEFIFNQLNDFDENKIKLRKWFQLVEIARFMLFCELPYLAHRI